MIENGKIIKSESGDSIRIDSVLKAGGQGAIFLATKLENNQQMVVKFFFTKFDKTKTAQRIHFLIEQKLHNVCPVFKTPLEIVINDKFVGYYAPFVKGQLLSEFLQDPGGFSFMDSIILGIAIVQAVDILHKRNIAHGDLHTENIFIHKVGKVYECHLIDFDNFNTSGIPKPDCLGQILYFAPEIRLALGKGVSYSPDIKTDLFSLGVLMHEIILLKHIAAGADDNENLFHKAMCSGLWLHDPAHSIETLLKDVGGYPSEVLNADIMRLFRTSISLDRDERPTAEEWKRVLCKAINEVFICENCNGPCLMDASKVRCPLCKQLYPILKLVINKHKTIPLDSGAILIGRNDFGGAPQISQHHVTFRRIGPETKIESFGRNGTFRAVGEKWLKLPNAAPILLKAGDRLLFADIEAHIIS